jgi:hypothetical protein
LRRNPGCAAPVAGWQACHCVGPGARIGRSACQVTGFKKSAQAFENMI